jgi:hypothetical protein
VFEDTRIVEGLEEKRGVGDGRRLLAGLLALAALAAALLATGNVPAAVAAVVFYPALCSSRRIGPYLGIRLETWEE